MCMKEIIYTGLCITILMILSCSTGDRSIRIKGSDTEVNLTVDLAEAFHQSNPEYFISVSGGGSGMGIASLLNNTTDISNSSRRINEKELELFNVENIELDSFLFAMDAIAFVVNASLNLDTIHIQTLSQILNGSISNWHEITGQNLPVTIYGRQNNSGTYDYVKHTLSIQYSPKSKQMNGNAQILESVRQDKSGIGYVGAGYVMHGRNEGLKVLYIQEEKNGIAISPVDSNSMLQGQYYFKRPLYQYYKKETLNKIQPFLEFEKSKAGKNIILKSGYFPIDQ